VEVGKQDIVLFLAKKISKLLKKHCFFLDITKIGDYISVLNGV
jgi:hypothetical protein